MENDFFFESDDDDFFGQQQTNQVASPRTGTLNEQGQISTEAAAPLPPPPPSVPVEGGAQITGTMDTPYGPKATTSNANPLEVDMMAQVADKLGIKQTELKPVTIPEGDTLNEPIVDSFKRDCSGIWKRGLAVILPCLFTRQNLMKETDFFGPLIITMLMGIFTSIGYGRNYSKSLLENQDSPKDDPATYYIAIFLLIMVGSILSGINIIALGGTIGVGQSFTLLGYSTLPMMIASIVLAFIPNFVAAAIVETVVSVWGIIVSVFFMNRNIEGSKKPLAVYPIILIFIALASFESMIFGAKI